MSDQDATTRLNAALEGRYRIERQLGEGGMATVYLADDVRHERKVALKVLRPELAAVVGADRFLAEIKTTAKLQHPHILPLHDSGEADSFLFYVMPYVEGESLRERLDREHQLPVDEAVRIATDVAEALDYAHAHGVIHRDIKPANILLHAGRPLIADFGIALAVTAGGGGRLTETGLSLGTPHYMSPEQATGDQGVGAPSDIYALGCVLYEMLVGEPPYTGSTAQAILGKIVTGDADPVTKHRRSVPANVDAAIRRALEKVPADRFPTARDLAAALGSPAFRHGESPGAVRGASAVRRWQAGAVAAGVVAIAAVGAGLGGFFGPASRSPRVARQEVYVSSLDLRIDGVVTIDLASDGTILYRDRPAEDVAPQLFYKAADQDRGQPIPGTEQVSDAVFSPDGQRIAYWQDGTLLVRPVRGGAATTLTTDARYTGALAWLDDGTVVYGTGLEADVEHALERIGADGSGEPEHISTESAIIWARPVRGHAQALITLGPQSAVEDRPLGILDLRSGGVTWHLRNVARAWYVPSGQIVYVRGDGAVFATPYDPESGVVGGAGVPLFEGVLVDRGRVEMVLGDDGTLLYVRGEASGPPATSFVWHDREGGTESINSEPVHGRVVSLALSPDGQSVAFELNFAASGTRDIYVMRLPNGPPIRLTPGDGRYRNPAWTSDGRSVVFVDYSSSTTAIVRMRADRSTLQVDTLYRGGSTFAARPTPDDQGLVFDMRTDSTQGLFYLDLRGDGVPLALTDEASAQPRLSPDGRWLAYAARTTDPAIPSSIVRPFPDASSGRWAISTARTGPPFWSRDGTELFYAASPRTVTAVSFEARSTEFEVGDRVPLFDYTERSSVAAVDVDPSGERFLVAVEEEPPGEEGHMILVLNWLEELREQLSGS